MRNKRSLTAVQRWGAIALTLLLSCALWVGLAITASARGDWQGEVVDPAIPKPIVTIQGNLVTEKGKPTGFYELALCVQSGRTIVDNDSGLEVDPDVYDAAIAADPDSAAKYTVTYYPFRSATAAMNINTDILTAVNWNLTSVTYETYDATAGYPSDLTDPGKYPRGINTDPTVQGYAESGLLESEAFPDITTPDLYFGGHSVALDVEGDARMFTAEGVVEHFENDTALLTLSAAAPDNHPVVLPESTPLVVARFSYDLKRFSTTKVNENLGVLYAQRNSITGDVDGDGFWMGWDKTSGGNSTTFNSKQALTWLGESTGSFDFSDSDELISRTQGDQAVWVHMGTNEGSVTNQETYFYYYLGAEEDQKDGSDTVLVNIGGVPTPVDDVTIPKTAGQKVLTAVDELNEGTPPAEYTYFRNLLRLKDDTLVVKLVNEPTFKRPANANDNIILFYDWDDTLIGSLAVGKGDVRAEVEAYIEDNLVHPELRPDSPFMDDGSGNVDLDKVTSLQRDYTYRGKYAYTVGGDDTDPAMTDVNGKEYPLTNKLDYVFTKRVNTIITQEENGATVQYVHPYALNDPALDPDVIDNDAAEFPYVYGWAVVEDTRAFNGKKDAVGTTGDWKVMHDAAKLEDVWTTMGVGELSNMTSAVMTNSTLSTVTVDPTAERTAPAFLKDADPGWTDGTIGGGDYAYTLSGANSYLRFADFSDITAELERYEGKNTLIVKAVYEPGSELFSGGQYRMVSEPYYNKLNDPVAAEGGAYSVTITLERSSTQRPDGFVRGVNRVRQPAIRQDTTIDQKWIEDVEAGIKHDLANPSIEIARQQTETAYTKVDIDNGEQLTFTLSLTARQNKVDYFTMETYGTNFVSGGQRSASNYDRYALAHAIDNYLYLSEDGSQNDAYFDQQGVYYQAARYDVREGTHGFVLYGTLNYLMQQATLVNQGAIDNTAFNSGATNAAFADINLRLMSNGAAVPPSTPALQTTIRTALKNAADDCEKYHYGDPDFWNNELDCAELSYHQLQHYILGNGLMTRAAADADKITWCHLHKDCFVDENAAQIPSNWEELIAAARSEDPEVQDAIGMLTSGAIGTIEEIAGLRTKNTGDYFASASDFKNQIIRAVSVLDGAGISVSWPTVQYYMLTGTAPASEQTAIDTMKANYWWYDGAALRTTPDSLSALSDASQDYFNDVTLKDGVTHNGGFTAKMAPAKAVFDINAGVGENEASANWVSMTRNLVKAYENFDNVYDGDGNVVGTDYGELDGTGNTTKFRNYTEFTTYWLGFQGLAREIGLTAEHEQYWELIQYYVLQTTAGNAMDATELQRLVDVLADPSHADYAGLIEEFNGYWWKDGKKRLVVNSISTLLRAARQANEGGDTTPLDRVTMETLEKLYLRGSKTGQSFAELGLSRDDVIDKIKVAAELTKVDGDPTSGYLVTNWNDVQYYLIHDDIISNAYLEANFYWWKNGGTGTVVNISGGGSVAARANLLMEAVIRGSNYGDPKALSTFTDPTKIYSDLALLQTYPGSEFTLDGDGMPASSVTADIRQRLEYTSVNDLISAVSTLMDNARAAQSITTDYTAPTLNWWQMQYGLLHSGTYIPAVVSAGSDYYNAYMQYWWYTAGEYIIKEPEPDPEATEALWDPINTFYEKNMTSAAATTLKNKLTIALLNNTYKIRMDDKGAIWTAAKLTPAKLIFAELATDAKAGYYKDWDGDGNVGVRLTWAQMQVYFTTATASTTKVTKKGDLLTPEAALDRIVNQWGWTAEGGGGANAFIPEWVNLSGVSGASLLALDGEAFEPEVTEAPTLDDLLAQKAELEKQLAALEEQIAAAQEAAKKEGEQPQTAERPATSTRPSAGTTTSVPTEPETPENPVTPKPPAAEDNTPVEVDTPSQPEPPTAESTDERVEIPLGEEVQSATRRPIATDGQAESVTAVESATPTPAATDGQTGSGTEERSSTDLTVGLLNKIYRLEPDTWKKRWTYAA